MRITLSTPSTPLRDAFYVGMSVLLCFVASAYFIYNQASVRNNIHNRQHLETIAWQTSALLDSPEHERLATTQPGAIDPKDYFALQKPVRESKSSQAVLSRIYTVGFDGETPRMIVDSEGFPARTWERLPLQPGKSGDFSKETLYFCALSVLKTGKGWVGEIAYPGGDSFVVAMVPIFSAPGVASAVMVVESTADRLQPTLTSLRSAALSSVIIGAVVSLTVALAVYSYRRRNLVDSNLLATVALTESALIEAIGEAIYRFDPLNESLAWQGNLGDLGWPTPKNVPTNRPAWLACIHPDDSVKCVAAWSGSVGTKWNVEYRIFGGDGRLSWLLDRGQHIEVDGRRRIAVGTILNITPLRETERRLRDVVDAAGEFIWEVDVRGNYTYLSERVVDVLGYPLEKLIGHHPLSLVPSEDLEIVRGKMLAITSEQRNFRDFEHRMLHGDGKIIWVSINGVPISGASGQFSGFRGAGLDVTARKSAEKELIREKEAAQAADLAKSEFLAVMSHEIRTPLNSVLGFADLLTDTKLTDAQKEQVGMIRRSGDALLTLLNDILDFSRIESGKMPILPSAVEIRSYLNEVADIYRATAHSKNVDLCVVVDTDVPAALRTDPGRLRQILLNLIGNAVKFTPAGAVNITAKRNVDDPGDGRFPLFIEIEDSGIGIPPDRIGRLFKPFSQADSSTTRRFGGTGLGLVICKRLAEILGGDVSLLRSSPSGSVFALELPLEIVEVADVTAPDVSAQGGGFPSKRNWRVLVVEDNPVNCMLAQRMLTSMGISSESRSNGRAAAEAHEQSPFDVIFMDLQMPVMDGLAAVVRIREFESAHTDVPKCRIIALTADAMSGDRERCLAAGMDDYLSKPIRRPEVATVMARADRALSEARRTA